MQDHGVHALIVALVSINENTIDAKLTTKLEKKDINEQYKNNLFSYSK